MSDKFLTWEEAVQWLKDQPERQELVQHCYYDNPVLTAAERFANSEEWCALKELLSEHIPGKVLDLGAGRGISSYAFAKSGCSVVSLEPDPSNLVGAGAIRSLVQESKLPIQIFQEYGEQLPFPDKTFDIVYGRAVLHHAEDLPALCKEAGRVLKPGGIFVATREHVISKKEDLPIFLEAHALHHLYGGEHAYLLNEYTQAIQEAGFQLRQVIGPMESVINYAPLTQKGFSEMLLHVITRRVGKPLAQWMAKSLMLQKLYGRYISIRSDIAGRHYSFLAVKK
jgi:ubiquinone/menaquinone biosynthesis C-methylase UbiE